MDICSEHGDDIAFIGRDCPVCEQLEDIYNDHQNELYQLNQELKDEEDRNEDLLDQIDELRGQ